MRSTSPHTTGRRPSWAHGLPAMLELLLGLCLVGVLVEALQWHLAAPAGLGWAVGGVYLGMAVMIVWAWPTASRWLGWANRVTLLRGILVALLAGSMVFPAFMQRHALEMAGLALLALCLDGLDGWVARHTHSVTGFGARFDMELDAFFIAVLCCALVVLDKLGGWVLLCGALRYVFVAAGWVWHWLQRPLPPSFRRQLVCVWQVASLLVALLPFVAPFWAMLCVSLALVLLTYSFAIDVAWLYRHRRMCI
ncbi:CDP-alcohol phosphatidyltransferase family protein [Chromohalobacter nigrandesensis]|uniref:CDP-alcohol phosphatidyltransferase family protein n=1 Tax=Chromohalobacter nigrandesensis TaxID=119863 RepID=UPI001FF59544|nr:CDP-alcohol phosphatidyltransferase family protein [Chromohalobacter nigrandesensis]MCK0744165.1 CDP-alcohol phosphatidyltransferase family protein [Chromohalobacter nigrandesensis]